MTSGVLPVPPMPVKPVQKTRMPECLVELAGRFGRREIVMIFSDFFADLFRRAAKRPHGNHDSQNGGDDAQAG